jgi:hypothetical protein
MTVSFQQSAVSFQLNPVENRPLYFQLAPAAVAQKLNADG